MCGKYRSILPGALSETPGASETSEGGGGSTTKTEMKANCQNSKVKKIFLLILNFWTFQLQLDRKISNNLIFARHLPFQALTEHLRRDACHLYTDTLGFSTYVR